MTEWLWGSSALACLVLSAQLFSRGLCRRYPALMAFSVLLPAQSIVQYAVRDDPRSFSIMWVCFEPLVQLSFLLLALEWYGRTCEQYPGIGRFGDIMKRWGMMAGMAGVSLVVFVMATFWVRLEDSLLHRLIQALILSRFWILTGSCIAVLIWRRLWRRYPRPMPQNLARYGNVLAVLLGVFSLAWLHSYHFSSSATVRALVNATSQATVVACCVAWAVGLTKRGEVAPEFRRATREEVIEAQNRLQEHLDLLAGRF
jgi:hypothetical protein